MAIPIDYDKVREASAAGMGNPAAADYIGIRLNTLYYRMQHDPKFQSAWRAGAAESPNGSDGAAAFAVSDRTAVLAAVHAGASRHFEIERQTRLDYDAVEKHLSHWITAGMIIRAGGGQGVCTYRTDERAQDILNREDADVEKAIDTAAREEAANGPRILCNACEKKEVRPDQPLCDDCVDLIPDAADFDTLAGADLDPDIPDVTDEAAAEIDAEAQGATDPVPPPEPIAPVRTKRKYTRRAKPSSPPAPEPKPKRKYTRRAKESTDSGPKPTSAALVKMRDDRDWVLLNLIFVFEHLATGKNCGGFKRNELIAGVTGVLDERGLNPRKRAHRSNIDALGDRLLEADQSAPPPTFSVADR